jgi:hypothetical protein
MIKLTLAVFPPPPPPPAPLGTPLQEPKEMHATRARKRKSLLDFIEHPTKD